MIQYEASFAHLDESFVCLHEMCNSLQVCNDVNFSVDKFTLKIYPLYIVLCDKRLHINTFILHILICNFFKITTYILLLYSNIHDQKIYEDIFCAITRSITLQYKRANFFMAS